ncbi:MAG: FmdB family transcriptional regulator [Acidimicrobiales bacterium]|nr:FmdB family transcriptional regulator [Acidimicrobiales bacterium]
MPTYQYRCQSCREEFEVRQSFTDDALTSCPDSDCGGIVNKVFSSVGISFKGDGFYKNDHGSGAKGRKADAGSTVKSDSGSTDTGSTRDSNSDSSGSSKGSDSSGSSKGSDSSGDSGGSSSSSSGSSSSVDKATASAA